MRLFDTHAHLTDEKIYRRLDAVLDDARADGLEGVATVGYDWKSSLMGVRLAEKYEGFVVAAAGMHPHDAKDWNADLRDKFSQLFSDPKVVAIGEIGLDYYRDLSPRNTQKAVFIEQIEMAQAVKKPIIIHNRDAHADILKILKSTFAGRNGGIIHCFSGSAETAMECLRMGFFISFAGPLTYQNARGLADVCRVIPITETLIETDCPYLSPHPYRGSVNEPKHCALVARKISQLKNLSEDEAGRITTQNARAFYGLA